MTMSRLSVQVAYQTGTAWAVMEQCEPGSWMGAADGVCTEACRGLIIEGPYPRSLLPSSPRSLAISASPTLHGRPMGGGDRGK